MALDAKDKKIYDLLNDKMFIIPENQRKYVWEKENWLELIEDIKLVYFEKVSNHFIGSIVLKEEQKKDGIKNHYIIIDGQQRISTITILLCSMACLYAENNDFERFKGLRKFFFVVDNKNKSHTMISIEANKDIDKLITHLYNNLKQGVQVENVIKNIKISKNILDCFLFFYNILKEFQNEGNELSKLQNIIEDINYIDIIAKEDSDAYIIFEILNARGKPLTDFELLRNFILRYTSQAEKKEVKDKIVLLENLLNDKIETFLKHYVTHKYGKKTDKNENRPYKIIVAKEKENNKMNFLDDLILKANYYQKMINNEECSPFERKVFSFFKARRQQQFRPLILGLMHQKELHKLDEKLYSVALNYLYVFFMCYNVIGEQTSNKIEDIVYGYSFKLENEFSTELIDLMKKSMSERLPSETQFRNSIKHIKYSHNNKAYSDNRKTENIWAIFEIIERENGYTGEIVKEEFNIEHCYPDKETDLDLNYTVGNMMLLEHDLNSRCKDLALSEKIKYYEKSKLQSPKLLVSLMKNNQFDIEKRMDSIADMLYKHLKELSE